jgi:hypothetical protein
MNPNLDSNFEWAKDWNQRPTRCINLTQNAYDFILNTLESAAIANQVLVKQLLNSKSNTPNIDRFTQAVEDGIRLKLSIQELKRTGEII